jgi:hypothetical protein
VLSNVKSQDEARGDHVFDERAEFVVGALDEAIHAIEGVLSGYV